MTAAGLVCTSCGTELRADANFCDECGSPTTVPRKQAEYKQVTVLFADVVRSMDIAAAVGDERLREIMAEMLERSVVVVQRYGSTVDQFTGDGIMAVFGAPAALEDHAQRACLAALGIQEEAMRLADEVNSRDGVDLRLRVGMNSGEVIAGKIGSAPSGYTAVGRPVGMAQRMESVAPPGGVMLSESTSRLVKHWALLGDRELVHIKGAKAPVPARRLLGVAAQQRTGSAKPTFVGREWELAALTAMLDRSLSGRGSIVTVVGAPGIGKTRLVDEAVQFAKTRGVEVFSTTCESHASDIPFRVAARVLRAVAGVAGLDHVTARSRVRAQIPEADPQDLRLLDDLLGIADPSVALPKIDPDARQRRLTALIDASALARATPALVVIEDAHWIDTASETILADFVAVTPQTSLMVLMTYRPEYRGALAHMAGAQTIALAPLGDSESLALIGELLGTDPSLQDLAATIATQASGNPFFAEEIVRDLDDRFVLEGDRGAYICRANVADISVPATLQATIAARIDRLEPQAKRTLNAAAVVGSRFSLELLTSLAGEPVVDELLTAEVVDQVKFTPHAEYAFRHPLMRTVAYQSQLKSDRAELHRRLATAIEARGSADENAALIAEHLESAGEFQNAYIWHMRAGAWSANRSIDAAWLSWERGRQVADMLPADQPGVTAMRIAPRTLLCGAAWRIHADVSGTAFEELRELCTAAGDKASLAIAGTGLIAEHMIHGRVREGLRISGEEMALIESIGDPMLTLGLSVVVMGVKQSTHDMADILRWSQAMIDAADGDPTKGLLFLGSPLAVALAYRGLARSCLGQPGWREDFSKALTCARATDPVSHWLVVIVKYMPIVHGVLVADDTALREIEEALRVAEASGDDMSLGMVRYALAVALLHRYSSADRERGLEVLGQLRDMCLNKRYYLSETPMLDLYAAREQARRGDPDSAIPIMRAVVDEVFDAGQSRYFVVATGALAETLLDRGAEGDLQESQAAIDRLTAMPGGDGFVPRDILLLRLRALLAQARRDEVDFRELKKRYREMATSLGFEGHIAMAEAMT